MGFAHFPTNGRVFLACVGRKRFRLPRRSFCQILHAGPRRLTVDSLDEVLKDAAEADFPKRCVALFLERLDALLEADRVRKVLREMLAGAGNGKRRRVDVADKRDGRLAKLNTRQVLGELFGRVGHKRAVEGARRGKARETLALGSPRLFCARNGIGRTRNDNLTWAVA